jgi:hypothetical protein
MTNTLPRCCSAPTQSSSPRCATFGSRVALSSQARRRSKGSGMYLRKRKPKASCYSPAPDAQIGLPVTQPTRQDIRQGTPWHLRNGPAGSTRPTRGGIVEASVGLTIGMEACSVAEGSPDRSPRLAGSLSRSQPRLDESWHPSSMFSPSVSLSPKLRVTTAEMEHMPIYLRTFFRLLSTWVRSGRNRGVVSSSRSLFSPSTFAHASHSA